MKSIKFVPNSLDHMVLLEVLEYALTCAETEIDCNTIDGKLDTSSNWDTSHLETWIYRAKPIAERLDALPHVIDQAAEVQARVHALAQTDSTD